MWTRPSSTLNFESLMQDSTKSINEVVIGVLMMLKMLPYLDVVVTDLLDCSPACSKASLFFCKQFLISDADEIVYYFQHRWLIKLVLM